MTLGSIYMRIMIWRWKWALHWNLHPVSFFINSIFR